MSRKPVTAFYVWKDGVGSQHIFLTRRILRNHAPQLASIITPGGKVSFLFEIEPDGSALVTGDGGDVQFPIKLEEGSSWRKLAYLTANGKVRLYPSTSKPGTWKVDRTSKVTLT